MNPTAITAATDRTTTDRLGSKVLISAVWATMGKPGTLETFKATLAAMHTAGTIKLARLDLTQALIGNGTAVADIAASTITAGCATYNMICGTPQW